ncbi:sterol desaturase family protein [Legionella maioricensis]|uniref:Sterol desaturase family protein n=1 Tax=Legionella maioricensis TaxID=2896528 RepID=A0A9X2D1I8_9GAMM|nr:sterol desaturase family protein [Legionella maioricensis]MCL9684703.1 sterol desaturase family protein [Legionella maioricensis]MCL9687731.1 sterol desaturase family protein [Legionella maioricensis]
MSINFIVLAAPVFLILIVLEYFISRYKRASLYYFNDSINNFCSGILEQIGALPIRGLLIYSYYYLYEHHAFFHFSPFSIISWILLWLAVDFCYYWFHRSSHRVNFFWIGHSVHHQSELYNLSVALRQGYLQTLTSWIFYLPLALIGFPTTMFVTMASLNSIYQFWIHTQTIKKMGWFEHVFNTPSHHRVHHGKNPQYIDKNYAGSLIIWDKLFGTFEAENTPVEYGVTEPLDSWNPFYANIKVIKDLFYYGRHLKNKLNLLRAFFMPPEWIVHQLKKEGAIFAKQQVCKKNSDSPKLYMLLNLALIIVLYVYVSFTFNNHSLSSWMTGSLILLTIYGLGRVANGNLNIRLIEIIRTTVVITSLELLANNPLLALSAGLLFFASNYLLFNIGSSRTSPSLAM